MEKHYKKNTISVIFLFCLLIYQSSLVAQTFVNREWVQILGTPDTVQWSASAINTYNQLITTGNTLTPGQQANILTTAYDDDGNILWQQQWNGPQNGSDYGAAVTTDDQGNIYIAGASHYSTDSTFDITLIMYDQYGSEVWHTAYSGEGLNNIPFAIASDNENNLYITGTSEDHDNGYDYILLKFSPDGELLWDARYDYNGGTDIATSLVMVNGGEEIAVTGGSETTGGNWDYTTVLYSNQGIMLSVDRQPSDETSIEKPKDIVRDSQNNFYLTGVENNGAVNQIKLMKLGHDLQPQWVHSSTSGYEEGSNAVAIDPYFNSYVGGWVEEVAGNRKPLLMKYDTNGNLLWANSFLPDPVKPHAEITRITIENNRINFIGFATDGFSSDIFTGQLAADGELNWLRSWTNMGNSIDYPTSIVSTRNNIYVSGRTTVNNVIQWVTVKYSHFELPPVIVDDTINQTRYLDCQVVVKINQELLNHPFHNNRELQFYSLHHLLHDTIITQMEDKTGVEFSSTDLNVVKLHWEMTPADTLSVSRLGDTVRIPDFWNTLILEIPEGSNLPAVRDSLRSLSFIVFDADLAYLAEPLSIPNDNLFLPFQHSLHASAQNPPYLNAHINILPAWDIETGKPNIRIAVIDDPIYWDHEDFDNPALQPNGSVIADGWNYYINSSIFNTPKKSFIDNHGTSIAGIIGAIRNNSTKGIAGIAGGDGLINPGVRLYSLGVSYGQGSVMRTWVANAIRKASSSTSNAGFAADVINISLGWPDPTFYEKDAILSAYRNQSVVVAARGNTGSDALRYPACYNDKLVISVGASGTDGTYKRKSEFMHPSNSNNGTTDYGSSYTHIDLIAPGVHELVWTTNWPTSPLGYHSFTGTSAAAPHVTGVVGLLLSRHHPSQGYPNGLAPEDIEYILKSTATDISGSPPNTTNINFDPGPDPYNGHGRLNAGAALNLINMPEYQILHPTAPIITQHSLIKSYELIMFGGQWNSTGYGVVNSYVFYEADLYRVTYTTHQLIPAGYQVEDYWIRESSSYGTHPNNFIYDADLDRHYAHIYFADISTNPITVQGQNFYWHIKKNTVNNHTLNLYYPPNHLSPGLPQQMSISYSLLLHNPTVSVPKSEENTSDLIVFPNPASERITIDFSGVDTDNGNIYIYDMFGRVVDERVVSAADQGQITIPVTNLAKGVYLCVLVANNKRHIYRFCRL